MCLVTVTGSVHCTGDADFTGSAPRGITQEQVPSAQAVATAGFDVCVLTPDSRVRCWGDNTFGQLGDGSSPVPRSAPSTIDVPICR